jgi:hypothetical protein
VIGRPIAAEAFVVVDCIFGNDARIDELRRDVTN